MTTSKKNQSAKQKGRGARKQTNRRGAQSGRPPMNGGFKRSTKGPRMSMGAPTSSHAALRAYARVNLNPFSEENPGVPTFPLVPSLKFTNHERVVVTGSATIGWFTMIPVWANTNLARLVGTADAFGNSNPFSSSGFPYSSASFATAGLKGRIVATGFRVRNITSMLNRGGSVYVFRDPDGNSLVGSGLTVAAIAQYAQQGNWKVADASGDWSTLIYNKTDPDDYDYNANSQPLGTADCIGCYFTGAGTAQTYEIEIVTHAEYIGTNGGFTLPGVTRTVPSLHTQVLDAHINHHTGKSVSYAITPTSVAHAIADAAATGKDIANFVGQGVADARKAFGTLRGVAGLIGM